jgi:hypothetical protein
LGAWLACSCVATGLACGGLSDACRRPSHFSLLAQREVTKRNGLTQPGGGEACKTTPCLLVRYSQSHCRRYAASARWPKQVTAWLAAHRQTAASRIAHVIATSSCHAHSLALTLERSRHSGGNDSLSSEPCRRGVFVHALGPDGLTQAISLGYFSLGQQREVTRAAVAVRKPAASEPGHAALWHGEVARALIGVQKPAAGEPGRATLQRE